MAELSLEGNEMLPTALFELTELSEWANVVVTGCEHEAPLFVAVNGNWFEPGQGF